MNYVHWSLVAVAFLLGMGVTGAMMVRRVDSAGSRWSRAARKAAEVDGADDEDSVQSADVEEVDFLAPADVSVVRLPGGVNGKSVKVVRRVKKRAAAAALAGDSAEGSLAEPVTPAPVVEEKPVVQFQLGSYAPFGRGSARATLDGGGPAGWLIKARSDSRLYYTPEDSDYRTTLAQIWFKDEASAIKAFFTPARKSLRQSDELY